MWAEYLDMSSGGDWKTRWGKIYLEAEEDKEPYPDDQFQALFMEIFKRSPYNVTCECCGADYSVFCGESLEEVSGKEGKELQRHLNKVWVLTLNKSEIQRLRQGLKVKGVKI